MRRPSIDQEQGIVTTSSSAAAAKGPFPAGSLAVKRQLPHPETKRAPAGGRAGDPSGVPDHATSRILDHVTALEGFTELPKQPAKQPGPHMLGTGDDPRAWAGGLAPRLSYRTSRACRRKTGPIVKQATVWTENAKHLKERLNYKIFTRIEVQEMLSPEKLREIRLGKVQTGQPRHMMTRSDTDGSDTPLEPFHMEDLPLRIGQAGVSLAFNLNEAASHPAGLATQGDGTDVFASSEDDVEIFVMQGTEMDDLEPQPPPYQTDDFIFLPSTHFSLTRPGIQHGQIRLTKADLTHKQLVNIAAAMDDTLDWTAFQMAILGGAGDMFGEATDFGRASDEDLDFDESLGAWFDDFGFDGPGGLIGAAEAALVNPPSRPDLTIRDGRAHRNTAAARHSAIVPPTSRDERSHSPYRAGGRKTMPAQPSSHDFDLGVRDNFAYYGNSLAVPDEFTYHGKSPPAGMDESARAAAERRASGYITGGAVQPPKSTPTPPRQQQQQQQQSPFPRPHRSPSRSSALNERKRAAENNMLATDAALGNTDKAAAGSEHRGQSRSRSWSRGRAGERPSLDSVTSRDSLPQSPMMDLVMSKDHNDNEYVVSMGYNLSHDLGDYLQWEAQNGSGSGFY
ncbi:hypothetical protein P8C59_002918 [Phyllachora maydis]|uniref:Uncharacterized protein n=1 Tax=Phyllachora maydis TaxID=1825666 RepID=A0AAD9HZ70_9PEZI|nr:hypothetical protein P8C59_002918 [Phyllachora maydis]